MRWLALAALLLLTGCPNPNTYGTPRTVEPGTISHTVSIEVVGMTGTRGGGVLPAVPSYTMRIGLANRFDLGIRAANFSSAMVDLKWNVLKTRRFDIAFDPGTQWMYDRANDVHIFQVHAPVMFGLNLRSDLILVFVPGFTMQGTTRDTLQLCPGAAMSPPPCGSELTRLAGATGPMLRIGAGLHWRIFRDMAVQPELTVMHMFGSTDTWVVNGGIGISFVHLPRYDDVDAED